MPRCVGLGETDAAPVVEQVLEIGRENADVMPVDALDLADFGRVDVELRDLAGVRCERCRVAGNAVVESRANGDQEIAVLDCVVGGRDAMHAEHVQGQRVLRVTRAECHQRRRYRNAVLAGDMPQRFGGIAVDDAAARVDQRPFGFRQHGEKAFACRIVETVGSDCREPASIPLERQLALTAKRTLPVLHVLRNVHDDRTGPAAARQFEGAAHSCLELLRVGNEQDMLGNGAHDGRDRRFLERIGADCRTRHLAADDDERDRIRHAVTNRRHRVRGAGTGRHHDDADLGHSRARSRPP